MCTSVGLSYTFVPLFFLFLAYQWYFNILYHVLFCSEMTQALDLFQEGLDIAHENVLRCLELMWMRFMDDASHYNHITGMHIFVHCVVLCVYSALEMVTSKFLCV